jgi:CDP-glucose 4,6-dehydratase
MENNNGPHEANFLKLDCSRKKSTFERKPEWDIKTAVEKVVEFAKLGNNNERLICIER